MPIPLNAKVRQVVPVIEGVVAERRFSEASEGMEYRVEFKDSEGNAGDRWFAEGEIEEADNGQA
jgi:hypothetical protein